MPKKTTENPPTAETWAGSADDWRRRNVHNAELPSGMRVTFRRLSLGYLITKGALPDDLRELAAAEYASPGAGASAIAAEYQRLPADADDDQEQAVQERVEKIGTDLAALNRELCAAALISPTITAAELAEDDFPIEDLEMLAGFLTGLQHVDAAGRVIGVAPLSDFATFCHHPGGPEACATCQEDRRKLSTAHVGDL
jgi:hypothetical protein